MQKCRVVLICLESCFKDVHNQHIRIMSDSTVKVAAISNQGSTKSASCHQVAVKIWEWALDSHNWISAAHIAGKLNCNADRHSREFHDDIEWGRNVKCFQKIQAKFGPHDIDLFASMYNFKIKELLLLET